MDVRGAPGDMCMRRLFAIITLVAALLVVPAPAFARSAFGIHTPGDPFAGTTHKVDNIQRSMGRRVGIVHWFQNWSSNHWNSSQPLAFRAVKRSNRIPLLTWEPWRAGDGPWQPNFSLERIAGGAFDAYISSWARGLRRLKSRVYLRPMHEMNGNWYPWAGTVNNNSPALFKTAWRRMVTLFRREGAKNVRFVWSPVTEDSPGTRENRLERYYPGRRYVHVLGMDGYNWGSTRPEFGGWRTFRKTFSRTYSRLKRLGPQPIWIPEVGSSANGGDKAKWIRGMFRSARKMNRVRAIIYMDTFADGQEWGIDYPAGTAAAFRARK